MTTNFYFQNLYECPCGETWEDEWDSSCDDRCPTCNTPISPSESSETGLCLALMAALDMYDERWMEVEEFGDEDTPDECDRWAEECFTIYHAYSDFFDAAQFFKLGTDFRKKAQELRDESYGA